MNHVLLTPKEINDGSIPLYDPRALHILNVLRIKLDEEFRVGVLNHSRGKAKITACDYARLQFCYTPELAADTLYPITLIIGATRPSVMQRILRDVTAFGVEKIIIFHTQNSEKSYLHSHLWKNEYYQKYIDAGLCLAKSVRRPNVHVCFSLEKALQEVNTPTRILADDKAEQGLGALTISCPLSLAVGPERGFTAGEITTFQDAGFLCGHLGQRIIRAETACFVALSLAAQNAGIF
ncbi:MAG: RsmE family RNA methyltransferase [Spirochaetia bacterium]